MAANIHIIRPGSRDLDERDVVGLVRWLRANVHQRLREARVALAWRDGWRPDPDGRVVLAQARRVGPLDRLLHGYDFAVEINRTMWLEAAWPHRRAVMDHELTHCAAFTDEAGAYSRDESGKIRWRIRGHDVEEFVEVVERNGIYKGDLERLAGIIQAKENQP